jgi:magnesium and cobalt exporter, CNNM family
VESLLPSVILIAALLTVSGFFSGSETALFSLSAIQKDRLARSGAGYGRRINALLAKPRRLIVTILMGNEMVNVSISAVSAAVFAVLLPGNRWAPVLIVTAALLIVGEISPKSVAITRPILFSRIISAPLTIFYRLVSPARWIVFGVVVLMDKLTGHPDQNEQSINEEEFRQLALVGFKEGVLARDEAEMIRRVFDLGETTVEKIMTPRTEITALPEDLSTEEAIEMFRTRRRSRLPVYRDTIDDIVGVLHANDILRHKLADQEPKVGQMVRSPLYVPAAMKADEALRLFRQKQTHLAIVIDEYGGTAGLITLDDVLAELFGELLAERADEDFTHHRCENGDLIVAGAMELEDFTEMIGQKFEKDDVETVGGLIFSRFGHLPAKGDKIQIDGLRVTVLSVKENRIWRMRIARRPA